MREKFILEYPKTVVEEPIIYVLVKRFDVKINILRAEISSGREGSMLVELESEPEDLGRAHAYLAEHGVRLIPIAQSLRFDEAACVHCGACTGVCFSGCLSMDRADWKLAVDREKCIACGLCVKACPFGLFSLHFGE